MLKDTILKLGLSDILEIMDLEKICFQYHWTEKQFRLGLKTGAFTILGIREQGSGQLIGYIAYSLIADEMEILNLAVLPNFRQKGYGALLLQSALKRSFEHGARQSFLDVKVSNTPAFALYKKFGFTKIGVRTKYYPDTGEDAMLMKKELASFATPCQIKTGE